MRHAPDRLGDDARAICGDRHSELLLSLASSWELAIKLSIGKLRLREPLNRILVDARTRHGIAALPIDEDHIVRVQHLPLHHRDPFDRLLIAQALAEGLTVVSKDVTFDLYGVPRVW